MRSHHSHRRRQDRFAGGGRTHASKHCLYVAAACNKKKLNSGHIVIVAIVFNVCSKAAAFRAKNCSVLLFYVKGEEKDKIVRFKARIWCGNERIKNTVTNIALITSTTRNSDVALALCQ